MNKQRFSRLVLVGGFIFLGSFVLSKQGLAQSDCTAPGFNCPVTSLFTDGVNFVFGTSCCTPDGPACLQTFSTGLYIYTSTINSAEFGCETSGEPDSGCECKTSQTPAGNGSGVGKKGELTFNPDKASPVSITNGKCDDYFVKVGKQEEYYRCFNVSFNYQGNVGGGKFAIRATKKPTKFAVQSYTTTKMTVDGASVLKVTVPSGSANVQSTFKIVQKM